MRSDVSPFATPPARPVLGLFSQPYAIQEGTRRRIVATPAFYVTGERFEGALPLEELRRVLAGSGR